MTDYATLLNDAQQWASRDDVADVFPAALRMVEAEIARKVRTLDQMTDGTLTISAGGQSALFDDFLGAVSASVGSASAVGRGEPLVYMPINRFNRLYKGDTAPLWSPSQGYVYSYNGLTLYVFPPPGTLPSGNFTVEMTYFARYDALNSTTNPTNWLLANAYDVFLHGVLSHLWDIFDDEPQALKYKAKFESSLNELGLSERRKMSTSPRKRYPDGPTP